MAEDAISSFIIKDAIEAERLYMIRVLDELSARINTLPQVKSLFNNSTNFKELAAANRELASGIDKVTDSRNKLAESERKLSVLSSAKTDSDKVVSTKAVSGAYAELSLRFKEAELNAKNLAAQFGVDSIQAREAALAAAAYKAQLTEINNLPKTVAAGQAAEELKLRGEELELGRQRILQLRAQEEEEARLLALEADRLAAQKSGIATGNFPIQQGSGQTGQPKLVTPIIESGIPTTPFIPTTDIQRNIVLMLEQKQALTDIRTEQALLRKQLADNTITQEQYDREIVRTTQLELEYKSSLAATQLELKAQARVTTETNITGSINDLQARNLVLSKQRDQIPVVGSTGQDAKDLALINAELDKNNELIRINKDLLAQQKINIGNYTQSFKSALTVLDTELTAINTKLKTGGLGGIEVEELTRKQGVLTSAIALATKETNTATGAQKNYKEAAKQVGLEFGTNSSVFKTFTNEVKNADIPLQNINKSVDVAVKGGSKFGSVFRGLYSVLRQVAYAIPGIGLSGLILLLFTPLEALAAAIFKTKETATGLGTSLADLAKHAKDVEADIHDAAKGFEDAVKNVNELTINIDLAKRGFLDKNKVLKEYNTTIGVTTGQVKTLDEAEAALVKNGDAYIQMMLLKAAANIALGNAAQKAFQAEETRRKKESEFASFKDELTAPVVAAQRFQTVDEIRRREADVLNKRKNRRDQELLDEAGAAYEQLQIAKKFQADAAKIAKDFNFDFFGGKEDPKKAKKAAADQASILEELNRKIIEEQAKRDKQQLEIEKANSKEILSEQKSTLEQKLTAIGTFNTASRALIEKERQGQLAIAKEEERSNLAKAEANKKSADTAREREVANQEILASVKLFKERETTLNANAELSIAKNVIETETLITNAYDNEFKKRSKLLDEEFKKREEQNKRLKQDALDSVDTETNNKIVNVTEKFNIDAANATIEQRLDLERKFQDTVLRIEKEAEIKKSEIRVGELQKQLAVAKLFGADTTGIEKQITDEIRRQSDLHLGIFDKEATIRKEHSAAIKEKEKELANELKILFETIVFDAPLSNLDAKLTEIQKEKDARIAAINETTLAEADKAKRIKAIEKQAAFDTEQIDKRKRQLQTDRARFEKLASIASIIQSTRVAVIAALGTKPFTPFNLALAALVAGIGAAQLAVVVATPIPKFFKGTDNAPRGAATVSEKGKELVIQKDGISYLTPDTEAVIGLKGGEKIYPADVTKQIINIINDRNTNKVEKSTLTDRLIKNISEKLGFRKDTGEKNIKELRLLSDLYRRQFLDITKPISDRLVSYQQHKEVLQQLQVKENSVTKENTKTNITSKEEIKDLQVIRELYRQQVNDENKTITERFNILDKYYTTSEKIVSNELQSTKETVLRQSIKTLLDEVKDTVTGILEKTVSAATDKSLVKQELVSFIKQQELRNIIYGRESKVLPIIISQLPKFYTGTNNAPPGLGTVSEQGQEIILTKSGQIFLTPKHETLMQFIGGEKVYPNHSNITQSIINATNVSRDLRKVEQRVTNNSNNTVYDNPFSERAVEVLKSIEKKSGVTVINNSPIETQAYYQFHIKR